MNRLFVPFLSFIVFIFLSACQGAQSDSDYSDVTKPKDIKVTKTEPEAQVQPESSESPNGNRTVFEKVSPTPEENSEIETAQETTETDTVQEESETELNKPLEYVGWEIDERSRDAKVCFAFRQPVDQTSNLILRDYIDISPNFKFAQTVFGNDLCITGFDYAKAYKVTLKRGLPGIEDRKLQEDLSEDVSFGDKPNHVAFVGQGIILPRIGAQGLALETVNVDTLDVKIWQVSDRMIARRLPNVGQQVEEGRYSHQGRNAASQIRTEIWSGEVPVKNVKNENVTTVLPLKEMIGELEPGAYIVDAKRTAEPNERRPASAWRWIIVTDLAITSYRGENGLNATIRSIDTGNLQPGVEMALVANNNEILAKETSDKAGHVFFPPALLNGTGALSPKMVLAYGEAEDFAMLDLTRNATNAFSGQDISGRHVNGDIDIYAYSERGVYRPGEIAHFSVMLRDLLVKAQTDRPVTLSIMRPNGVIIETKRVETEEIEALNGMINWDYIVPDSAPRGNWKLSIQPEGTRNNKIVGFAVEDFVPQKLRFNVKADTAPIKTGDIRPIIGDAQFLYGAPGAELNADAEARLRLDPQPFKKYTNYQFGPHERAFNEELIPLGEGVTDETGIVEFEFDNKVNPLSSIYPMRAEVVIGVSEPGGRYIKKSVNVRVLSEDRYIGITPNYSGYSVPSGSPASLKIIALSPEEELLAQNLSWSLVQEDWDYQWYRHNGRWRYKYEKRDLPIDEGEMSLTDQEPYVWNHMVGSGSFRLDVKDGDKVLASRKFWSGWGRPGGETEAPDRLEVNTVNEAVFRGDDVTLTVRSPYAGQGELVIASDRVHLVRPITLEEGSSEISFDFDPDWDESVYALVTLYTPRDVKQRPVPRRAVGVSYIELDRSDQKLNLSIDTDEVIRPRQKHVFEIKVEGETVDQDVLVNFAAVDEGILQITKYTSPDAVKHYFSKKALGITFNDDYGRILNPNLGAPVDLNTGGDSLGGKGLTVVPTKSVSLFHGEVPVRNGVARIEVDMPDFNGELRLMATAWNKTAVGSVSAPVKVRDKVPSLVSLPRFLAPGDKALATISLDNVEGAAGRYLANLSAEGVLKAGSTPNFDLDVGQRKQDFIEIEAGGLGIEDVNLAISGPQNYTANTSVQMQVRSPYYPLTETKFVPIDPGKTLDLKSEWTDKFVMEETDVTVSFSKLPGIDPASVIQSLRRYPYGCTEQTVSTALPLIYAQDLGGIEGFTEISRQRAVQNSIYRLSNRVSKDGSFGLWRSGDRYAHSWVGVYATDFMFRAQKQGFYVPEDMLTRVTEASRTMSLMPRSSSLRYLLERRGSKYDIIRRAETAAYAHYVLASNGEADIGKVRYHFDNHRSKMETAISYAYIGGALKLLGDDERAEQAFDEALNKFDYEDKSYYYYSKLRDLAGIISIASEVGLDDYAVELVEPLSKELRRRGKYLNTQERGYLILAFKSLMKNSTPAKVSSKNVSLAQLDTVPTSYLIAEDLKRNPVYTNNDDQRIWASISINGAPKEAPAPVSDTIFATKTLYTKDGNVIRGNVEQGEEVVVVIGFKVNDKISRSIVIADLLPAGFEIETILSHSDGRRKTSKTRNIQGAYEWAGALIKPQIAEKRDDRFVASMTISGSPTKSYKASYVMRAVTPGDYVLPGVVIEDMYRAEDYGLSKSGRINISPRSAE